MPDIAMASARSSITFLEIRAFLIAALSTAADFFSFLALIASRILPSTFELDPTFHPHARAQALSLSSGWEMM